MRLAYQFICACALYFILQLPYDSNCLTQGDAIAAWAERLGKELWSLGEMITKKEEIMQKYKNVTLERKDPRQIITEIVGNVSYMMRKKMDAVECILNAAEYEAENYELNLTDRNYTYYRSNPPSTYIDEEEGYEDYDEDMYIPMTLNNDTHFFNLFVNITHSAVHVPTNVYHRHRDPEIAIRWSEVLDEVYQKNYKADPALSWQYFGSVTGIMRHYPAMEFGTLDKGLFDCRIRTWFIEASTCTKDVVILLDNTGSMMGMHKHIASLVVNTIMDTLSNNDYINIISYSEKVEYIVPCFENVLVQATEENILMFKKAVHQLDPTDKALTDVAMEKAFELLHEYRKQRNCYENSRYCNQAIMIVTDGLASNLSDVLNKYNRADNGSSIPIRIFTYIVGKEATHLDQALWIACNNRGYHTHVDSLEQVTAAVYKYVLVFARPLVLQGKERPLSWTHAYFDETFKLGNRTNRFEKYRLLTSVAGPAFDLKANKNTSTTTADLLGVAGTDVPINEIAKLMYPYKTGVNAHSFIVSNNGYVLKHPGLRPMEKDILKDNYNSVDLVEVEQLDDDLGARELSDTLIQLRSALVFGEEGVIHDVNIKYHYDDMRRVSREINDYYYAPIKETPFSIGFAIPDLYGNYSIEVGDEIERHRFSETNISSFFSGSEWKIHPNWVYCKYHYLEGHEYDTPESELLHFINRMYTEDFKWSKQYEEHKHEHDKCGAKTLNDDDYYCDRHLVQRLVFDALNTKSVFDEPWRYRNREERGLGALYNASLRFLATMSGLTRWEYLYQQDNLSVPFGDLHPRAIDETWYKSAVIQHRFNSASFVYSVPFESEDDEKLFVTGSFAIFPKKDDIEAPGAVIGFQFSHEHLHKRFFEITSKCHECLPCGEELDCYAIDSSGYIVISEDTNYTGRFFGEVDGAIMEAMIQQNIFEKLVIRDYQAICTYEKWVRGSSNILISIILGRTNVKSTAKKCRKCNNDEERWHEINQIPVFDTIPAACEKEHDLYILQQQLFSNERLYPEEVPSMPCVRPFFVHMIPHSNLLFVAIKTAYTSFCEYRHTTAIREIVYDNETAFPCQKLYLNQLPRRPLLGCFNEDPLEKEITDCGKATRIKLNIYLIIIMVLSRIV